MTLLEWADQYLVTQLPHASRSTRNNWQDFKTKLLSFLKSPGTLADMNRETLSAFMRHLSIHHGTGEANKIGDKFCALWRYLARSGTVDTRPPSPNPRAVKGHPGMIAYPKLKPPGPKARWRRPVGTGVSIDDPAATMRSALHAYYNDPKYSTATMDDMARAVDRWEEFGTRDQPIRQTSKADLDRFERTAQAGKIMPAVTSRSRKLLWRLVRLAHGESLEPRGRKNPPVEIIEGTLRWYFETEFIRKYLRGASEKTVRLYRMNLNHFDKFLMRPATLADLNDDTVADCLYSFPGARTGNKFRDQILCLWRFLARKRHVEEFPDVQPREEDEKAPVAWLEHELTRLFEIIQDVPGEYFGIPAGIWWHALHLVYWNTGERIGALIQLRWSDLDFETRHITIQAAYRKGNRRSKKKDRVCRLHPETLEVLRTMEGHNDLIFPWPYPAGYLWIRYREIRKRAGLAHDRAHSFHALRRSVASYFERAGGNATALLGHSARKVTERYLDPRITGTRHAIDLLMQPGEVMAGGES